VTYPIGATAIAAPMGTLFVENLTVHGHLPIDEETWQLLLQMSPAHRLIQNRAELAPSTHKNKEVKDDRRFHIQSPIGYDQQLLLPIGAT